MHGEGQTQGWGGRARPERTWNMRRMVVTLEVSQLEMSALKLFKSRKSWSMSVMAETHQSAMGPYVAVAAVGSALNASTAVFREALSVKVWDPWVQARVDGLGDSGGSEGGGGEGDGGGGDGEGGGGEGEGGGCEGECGGGLGEGGGGLGGDGDGGLGDGGGGEGDGRLGDGGDDEAEGGGDGGDGGG